MSGNTFEAPVVAAGLVAAGDLSTKQFYLMKVSDEITVTTNDSAGGPVVGALSNAPSAAGDPADVVVKGPARVIAGTGGVAAGALVASDNTGKAVTAAQATFIVGIALEAIAASSVGTILIDRCGYKRLDPT